MREGRKRKKREESVMKMSDEGMNEELVGREGGENKRK